MKKNLLVTFTLIMVFLGSVFAQQRTINGTVTSEIDGIALPGAAVLVKGTSNIGTITNVDGEYSITVPEDAQAIEFSFIGMVTQSVSIGNNNVIDVALVASSEILDEVVVTALGIKREAKALGFSSQQIGTEDLSASRELNISSYLTGKIAGVQVSKTAGGAGGSSSVVIRGNSSLSQSNQPLYVVDGIPIINLPITGATGMSGGLDLGDGIGDINPEDVESMTVLKGPNASALYGSRGANGVILISTKSGKNSKGIGVELNSNFSMDVINTLPNFQNEYGAGYEGTNIGGEFVDIDGVLYETIPTWYRDSWGVPLDGSRTVVDPFLFPGEDPRTMVLLPQDKNNVYDFYNVGTTNTNSIALSGSSDKSSGRLSIGNTAMTGIVPGHEMDKMNVSFRGNTQVSDALSIDGKINYIHTEGNQRPTLGRSDENVSSTFAQMGRYVPLDFLKEYYDETGDYGKWPAVRYNPYYVVNELKNNDYRDRFIGYVSANLKINDWLNLMGRAGADTYTQFSERTWPIGANGSTNSQGRIENSIRQYKDLNADVLLSAAKEVSSTISISGALGASLLTQRRDVINMDARIFKVPDVYHVSNTSEYHPGASLWEKEMQSVYGTAQVAYKNYLFLDITGRNDWSSALGLNSKSFFYPSIASSFVFTEAIEIDKNILSFGKIRASWAQVGNDSSPYLTQSGYTSYTTTYNGQSLASKSGTMPLWDLKNELTESWEIGADLRFFQNRISLDATYYNGSTFNQILPAIISNTSGYSSVVINAGEIQNKGLEIVLNANPINTSKGLRWDIGANYSKNKSMVISLTPGVETYILAVTNIASSTIEARPGEEFGSIIGYAYKRAPDGQRIVEGGKYVREDETSIIGNITPDWIGGLNNTISYKGFSLNVLVDFVQGRQIMSDTKYRQTAGGTGGFTLEGRRPQDMDVDGNQLPYVGVLDGVVEITDGDGNVTGYEPNTQAVDGQTYWATRAWGRIGEEFVMDGSYIMLRELMLSYRLQPSVLNKTPFSGLTLTLVGRNLFYISEHMQGMGVSPETSTSTSIGYSGIESFSAPTTRTYGLNIKLTF